ncbi:hypothetical protein ACXWTF_12570 [Thiomicrolovo sp. ZZH C-3]
MKHNYILKMLLTLNDEIAAGRQKREQRAKDIEINLQSDELYDLFELVMEYADGYYDLLVPLFEDMDRYDVATAPSVSKRNKNDGKYKHGYYEVLYRVKLLEHIRSIINLMIEAYNSRREDGLKIESRNELALMMMVALFHDIGKMNKLMQALHIDLGMHHELKSLEYIKHLSGKVEGYSMKQKPLSSIIAIVGHRVSEESARASGRQKEPETFNPNIKLFEQFDELSRDIEVEKMRSTMAEEESEK